MSLQRRAVTVHVFAEPIRADLALLKALQTERASCKLPSQISRNTLREFLKIHPIQWEGRTLENSTQLPIGTHILHIVDIPIEPTTEQSATAAPPSFELEILYEDHNLLALNKPHQIPSAPQSSEETLTATNFALRHFPSLAGIGYQKLEPGLVHRLDTGTSGVLLFAKTHEEFNRLRILWQSRKILKIYRALIQTPNPLPTLPWTLSFSMGHDAQNIKKMTAITPHAQKKMPQKRIRGKLIPAITHLIDIKNRGPFAQGSMTSCSDVWIQLETGVMHQIRCHLSAIHLPILGDSLYRGHPSSRLWLHAWQLSFLTASGTSLTLEAPLPKLWPR